MLGRNETRCLSVSPLAQHTVGQSGIQLAAVEIARAIASGFRTHLSEHIVSLDLLGSDIKKHYVAARPNVRPAARTSCTTRPARQHRLNWPRTSTRS